ncbi:MAG: winged helix-turn-helix transcriptional regulator [bacterium]|nr:winged helix-turn-helix transcriptional regulator [bacterium]
MKALTLKLDEKQFSKYFKAFGDLSRLRIIGLLAAKDMTVNEIVAQVDLTQSTVSRHLGVLREAEVVVDRREGQQVVYSLNKGTVENCCDSFCCCLDVKDEKPAKSKKKR